MPESYIIAIRVTAILTILLFNKVLFVNVLLGKAKKRAGARAPEDLYQVRPEDVTAEDKSEQERAQRMVNNDMENIPYGMIIAWGAMLCISFVTDGDMRETFSITHIIFYSFFVLARYAHSFTYKNSLSVPRSIAYLIGTLSVLAMGVNGAVASFHIEDVIVSGANIDFGHGAMAVDSTMF